MIPCHAGARGAGWNSQGGSTGGRGVSHAVDASKNAVFFSSGIDLAPAALVQSAKIGYHLIAQAGSFWGMYQTPFDLVHSGQ
jgi:hypothetical protein